MREFPGMESFVAFLEQAAVEVEKAATTGLTAAAVTLQHECREALGHYQAGAGPFPDWAPLSYATMKERDDWGYPPDEPELVTHELRDHILHSVDGDAHIAAVGVPSVIVGDHDDPKGDPHTRVRDIGEVAVAQELGIGLPQRSFLGLTAVKHGERLANMMAVPVIAALIGEPAKQIGPPEWDEIPF
jgi:hypothetical protein